MEMILWKVWAEFSVNHIKLASRLPPCFPALLPCCPCSFLPSSFSLRTKCLISFHFLYCFLLLLKGVKHKTVLFSWGFALPTARSEMVSKSRTLKIINNSIFTLNMNTCEEYILIPIKTTI